jgi:hypothetical protein
MNEKTGRLIGAIDKATADLERTCRAYLGAAGWNFTCSTPGSYWMWQKLIDGQSFVVDETLAVRIQQDIDCCDGTYPFEGQDEHPEDYDGPCGCKNCLANAEG